jgi:hypothetical protein
MTEPTHHLRRDVAAQLDILLAGIMANVGLDQLDDARHLLRLALADAWSVGERTGWRDSFGDTVPAQNPYRETDKS